MKKKILFSFIIFVLLLLSVVFANSYMQERINNCNNNCIQNENCQYYNENEQCINQRNQCIQQNYNCRKDCNRQQHCNRGMCNR